ncbi:MAG: pentapeptide repeat-containing protein, partial [Vulcanococcus sp.]
MFRVPSLRPLAALLALLVLLLPLPARALDTSAGVGLQDRALFQDTV